MRAGAGPPRQPTLRKNVRANGTSPCGTPTMPTVEPGRAIANAVVDRLRGADALQRGVDADAAGQLQDGVDRLVAAGLDDVGGAELAGQLLAVAGCGSRR